jgi:DNA mismatch repair protein MutS
MEHYFQLYEKYSKKFGSRTVIFMQIGAHYNAFGVNNNKEIFGNMEEISQILECLLTRRRKTSEINDRKNPQMLGFPISSIDRKIERLKNRGFTIVVVDQEGGGKNPKRSVTKIVNSSTALDNVTETNNIISIFVANEDTKKNNMKCMFTIGVSVIDVSTGKSIVNEMYGTKNDKNKPLEELFRFITSNNPSRIIITLKDINGDLKESLFNYLNLEKYNYHINDADKTILSIVYQNKLLEKVYKKHGFMSPIEYIGLEVKYAACTSFVIALQFAYEHDENIITNMQKPDIKWGNEENHMILSYNAVDQLNIVDNNNQDIITLSRCSNVHKTKILFRSLLDVIDKTSTKMGSRMLKNRILNPIVDESILNKRYDMIGEMMHHYSDVEKILKTIPDIERYHRKMFLGMLPPMEFVTLHKSYQNILDLVKSVPNTDILQSIVPRTNRLVSFMEKYQTWFDLDIMAKCVMRFHGNKSQDVKSFFRVGVNEKIDQLQEDIDSNKEYLQDFARIMGDHIAQQQRKTNKDFVKLHHTKTGYTFVTTAIRSKYLKTMQENMREGETYDEFFMDNVPQLEFSGIKNISISSHNIRNVSSNITKFEDELKLEIVHEYKNKLFYFAKKYKNTLGKIVKFISVLDVTKSGAKSADMYGYCRPLIKKYHKGYVDAKDLRHPIVERLVTKEYIPNDLCIGKDINGVLLYGINSSGKSTLMKALACSQIMAQSGCYVPASNYEYSYFTRIMTRIKGDDNMFQGKSQFIVEMEELRSIIKRSTERTLSVGDEICKGTEFPSANALVAGSIFTLAKMKSNFIFATHLHEINNFESIRNLENLKSFHIHVNFNEDKDSLDCDRKLREGSGPDIYGLEICKSLDFPPEFIRLSNTFLKTFMNQSVDIISKKKSKYNSKVFMDECHECGEKNQKLLQTHHINEQHLSDDKGLIRKDGKVFHKDSEHNLVVLCEKCHDKEHHG